MTDLCIFTHFQKVYIVSGENLMHFKTMKLSVLTFFTDSFSDEMEQITDSLLIAVHV